jgi:hypothetical protein
MDAGSRRSGLALAAFRGRELLRWGGGPPPKPRRCRLAVVPRSASGLWRMCARSLVGWLHHARNAASTRQGRALASALPELRSLAHAAAWGTRHAVEWPPGAPGFQRTRWLPCCCGRAGLSPGLGRLRWSASGQTGLVGATVRGKGATGDADTHAQGRGRGRKGGARQPGWRGAPAVAAAWAAGRRARTEAARRQADGWNGA